MLATVQEAVCESWTDALGVSPQPADNFFPYRYIQVK